MPNRKPWDDEDEDKTPYGVSGEALPPRPDVVGDADMDDRYAKPRRKKAVPVEDGEESDQPPADRPVRRKKRRKADRVIYAPDPNDERDKENEKRDWIITGTLFGLGIAFMLVAAVGISARYENISAAQLVLVSLLGLAVSVPVILATLAFAGGLLGIEYGTPVSAFRNLAAIYAFMNGIDWLMAWLGMPFMGQTLSLIVGIGLFMNRFNLDIWEMIASVVAIKLVSVTIQIVILFIAFGREAEKIRAEGSDRTQTIVARVARPENPKGVFGPSG